MARTIIVLSFILLASCSAGSGKGLDVSGRPIGEGPAPGDEPTLANIQARVFTPICTRCHIGAAAPQGMQLDTANAFDNIVGVRSREVGSLFRVEPFNPDDSYLVQKIEGTAAVGAQMPFGGPPLPAEDIMLIRQWILEGALDTPTAVAAQGKVRSVQVFDTTIRIAFTTELDASTVHIGTVAVSRAVGGPLGPIAVTDYDVSVAPTNANTVLVKLPALASGNTLYRISINAGDDVSLLSRSGASVEAFQMETR